MSEDKSHINSSTPSLSDHNYAKNANTEVTKDLALKSSQSTSNNNQSLEMR